MSRSTGPTPLTREEQLKKWLPALALAITVFAVVIPGTVVNSARNLESGFALRAFGASTAVVGVIAAGARLWAHNGSNAVDAFGKMLAYSAAVLAAFAAVAYFIVDAAGNK